MSFTALENTKGRAGFIISLAHLFIQSRCMDLPLHGREILTNSFTGHYKKYNIGTC